MSTLMLTVTQYVAQTGTARRTVMRWLGDDELPGAYQDERGMWRIPADAERTPRVDLHNDPKTIVLAPIRPASQVVPLPVSKRPKWDALPSFVPLDLAAELLDVTVHAIKTHPDYFGVVPFGRNGSHVIPLATVRRIRGEGS